MHFDIFRLDFWGNSAWQGIGVVVGVLSCLASPFLSVWVERLLGGKDGDQQYINAYKILALREGSFSAGETFLFIFVQLAAGYCLYLFGLRILPPVKMEAGSWLDLSIIAMFLLTWGCSAISRKKLAVILAWWWIIASMVLCVYLMGQKLAVPVTINITSIRHAAGGYIPTDIKHFPLVISIVHLMPWQAFPVDLKVAHLAAAQVAAIWIYGLLLALFLFIYTLSKRHYAQQASALAHLTERERKEKLDELTYQERQAALEIKKIEKLEKNEELTYKRQQITILLEKDKLGLEKEQLAVEATRLDLEKRRAEYMLELAKLLIDTLYTGAGSVEERAELLRQILPALKGFGQKDSTMLILEHLQGMPEEMPKAIPSATVVV